MVEVKNRFYFFIVVFVFCGAVVLIAVKDLRRNPLTFGKRSSETVDMQKIVRQLRGEGSMALKVGASGLVEGDQLSTRARAGFIHSEDKKVIQSILQSIVSKTEGDK